MTHMATYCPIYFRVTAHVVAPGGRIMYHSFVHCPIEHPPLEQYIASPYYTVTPVMVHKTTEYEGYTADYGDRGQC